MIDGLLEGYIWVGGFLPIVILTIFWYGFTSKLFRRLQGESNDTVRLETSAQYSSLPTLIIILIQIIAVGLIWVTGVENLIPIVALNFVFFYLTMLSVRFLLTHLDRIEIALLTYKKEDRENFYINKEDKLVYNKFYHINTVGMLVGILLIAFLGFYIEVNYVLEIFLLLGFYIIIGYINVIKIPEYIKQEYVDKVKNPLVEEGKIQESVEVQESKRVKSKEDNKEQTKTKTKTKNKSKNKNTRS